VSSHSIELLSARDVYLAEEKSIYRIIGNWSAKLEGRCPEVTRASG